MALPDSILMSLLQPNDTGLGYVKNVLADPVLNSRNATLLQPGISEPIILTRFHLMHSWSSFHRQLFKYPQHSRHSTMLEVVRSCHLVVVLSYFLTPRSR